MAGRDAEFDRQKIRWRVYFMNFFRKAASAVYQF